jgi:hypothetical protein
MASRSQSSPRKINPEVTEMREVKKEELSSIFERVARLYLEHATSAETIADTKGKDKDATKCNTISRQHRRGSLDYLIDQSSSRGVEYPSLKKGL